ncbi:cation-translocating P-type ATPase [Mucilaginibacter boryungensis]|uniref:Cation-translocating P-type ATPase n=1 Tax=Mucilaginibacter boryungensis TaxID=768480 RepID=A0ABR9XE82_9SPHI|nr:cation-translocating P-type ATPase [Mucilaginibacter boryungensis]MBE9665699.1 cation-translocating P-type ATPase [Mucilaginibacter boryungensis]
MSKAAAVNPFPFTGLSTAEAETSARQFGGNKRMQKASSAFWSSFRKSFFDPIFLLLVLAAVLYLLLDQTAEAVVMLLAMVLIAFISFYQERRSADALNALQQLTAQKAKVIRNNEVISLDRGQVVKGDYVVAEEGTVLAADGTICYAHDFAVNESLLTGEPASVYKSTDTIDNQVFDGTAVVSGLAVYRVEHLGNQTRLGKITQSVTEMKAEPSPLEKQIRRFVARMSLAGAVVFVLVWAIHFYQSRLWVSSLLKALTLAMSILPEEIPVAFTTFMALGAWRLMQKGILAKDVKTVEALGAATVICLDKTGTITANKMKLAQVYTLQDKQFYDEKNWLADTARNLINTAMWASESVPFDHMEKDLHQVYSRLNTKDERPDYHMEKEYPLAGTPPMMTHVFADQAGNRIIAAKGAPERLLSLCHLDSGIQQEISQALNTMTNQGYRVLAVAKGDYPHSELPNQQEDIPFELLGLIAFNDPPKPGIATVLNDFYQAGIQVKILTGDNLNTTKAIAAQASLHGAELAIEGSALESLTQQKLAGILMRVNIFTRMFPETKLKVINALKKMGHIVAMTGDGVNDAPALKAAHIGIAMGKRGSETARSTASLILLDDDLGKMTEAIAIGRQIYLNLKKAIRYIISIHIPIILVVTLPLMLHWLYPDIFMPVHVVFLELIMGPTCSVVYEHEPAEKGAMNLPPRIVTADLLTLRELSGSVWQGLAITTVALLVYQVGIWWGCNEEQVRALVFLTLITANMALTLIGRSFNKISFRGMFTDNRLMTAVLAITLMLTLTIFGVPMVRHLFSLQLPAAWQIATAVVAGIIAVIWYEPFKKQSP